MYTAYQCKVCNQDISDEYMADTDWDGETCSSSCADQLDALTEDLPWTDDDDWDSLTPPWPGSELAED
jgi:hypothetical protein